MTAPVEVPGDPDPLTAAAAEELRVQLARRNISRSELARRLGQSTQWVSQRTRAQVAMSTADIWRIAEALGVRPNELLPDPSDRAPQTITRGTLGRKSVTEAYTPGLATGSPVISLVDRLTHGRRSAGPGGGSRSAAGVVHVHIA